VGGFFIAHFILTDLTVFFIYYMISAYCLFPFISSQLIESNRLQKRHG